MMNYTRELLRQHTTAHVYAQGEQLSASVMVLAHTATLLEGWVDEHYVQLTKAPLGILMGTCSCGLSDLSLCKHGVALGLSALAATPLDRLITLDEIESTQLQHLLNDIIGDSFELGLSELFPPHVPEAPHLN